MALTSLVYEDGTTMVSVNFSGALTTALVFHHSTETWARGHALHNPTDAYNQTFGSDLAVARAKERLYHKITRKLSRGADTLATRLSESVTGENIQETIQINE